MLPLRADASQESVAEAIDLNFRASMRIWGAAPGSALRDDGALFWFVTGLPDSSYNAVMYANLASDQVGTAVAEFQQLRAQYGVPINWLVGPASRPSNLGQHLLDQGLKHLFDLPLLLLRLDTMKAGATVTAGLVIEPVDQAQRLEDWIRAEQQGYELEEELAARLARLRRQIGVSPSTSLRQFVGFLDHQPVATAAVCLAGGVAGIYDVTTIPSARKRGIGSAMTRAALQRARADDYHLAFLQPSWMGQGMYRRLGFIDSGHYGVYG